MDLAIMNFLIPQILALTGVDLEVEKHKSMWVLNVLRAIKAAKEKLSSQPQV